MKKLPGIFLVSVLFFGYISCSTNEVEKISIIYDTDMGNDIDDALALAMLYNYVDAGKVDLLGITISKANEYTIPYIDMMNRHYDHPDIPIGYVYEGETNEPGKYLKRTLETKLDGKLLFSLEKSLNDSIPEAYILQRKLLASQPDHSVVFIVVGFHTNIERLLESGPDEYSDLNGVELVRKKVKLLSVMAGCFDSARPEYNVVVDIPASQSLFEKWPGEVVISPVELGGAVLYPPNSILHDFGDPGTDPLCLSYAYYRTMPYYTPCFDLTSVLQAVEPKGDFFGFSGKGKVHVTDSGVTLFEPKASGKHAYLTITKEQIPKVRFALIRTVTGSDEINPILKAEVAIPPIDMSGFKDGISHWMQIHEIDYPRYKPQEVIQIANNVIQLQNDDGGWPKNQDVLAMVDMDSLKHIDPSKSLKSTFDNRNIYTQIEFLSKMYDYTSDEKYKVSALKGLDYILDARNPVSGGWRGADVDAITFNDDVMTGVVKLFMDIVNGKDYYSWISKEKRKVIGEAYLRSVDLILRCQVVVDGTRTAWGQQHDHHTLDPVKARSYELASLCSSESVGIIRLLMAIEDPDQRLMDAISDAVGWLEVSKIEGIRVEDVKIEKGKFEKLLIKEYDRVVVEDPDAPPIWARFYEIETNRPFMCNRDGIKVYSLAEVDMERRVGYGWYNYSAQSLLDTDYPNWKSKNLTN